mmetsp:Transcript_35639/g.31448  ORF Transcript_35639/g.31448 Transcript_35639/m.31448 type:complete len:152 (-) Transcript_35639:7-462(-)
MNDWKSKLSPLEIRREEECTRISQLKNFQEIKSYIAKFQKESLKEAKDLDYGDFHSMKYKLRFICKHVSSVKKEHEQELKMCLLNYVESIAARIQYELPQTTHGFYSILESACIITEDEAYKKWQELYEIKYPNGNPRQHLYCGNDEEEDE